jgi:hypothetical protein
MASTRLMRFDCYRPFYETFNYSISHQQLNLVYVSHVNAAILRS